MINKLTETAALVLQYTKLPLYDKNGYVFGIRYHLPLNKMEVAKCLYYIYVLKDSNIFIT